MKFLICNNEIIREEEVGLNHLFLEKQFVLTQKIWFGHGGIPLFKENIYAVYRELELLNFSIPVYLRDINELARISKRMLNKNKFFKSGLLTLNIYLNVSEINYTITGQAFPESVFPFSEKGLLICISNIRKLKTNSLNPYAFFNQNNWNFEFFQCKTSNYQGAVFLNENNMVCNGIGSNIFMVKDNVLITPALESGCYDDIIRSMILEAAFRINIKVIELSNIKAEHLLEMKEIFLASEEFGIQWVMGIENKRFVPDISKLIHKELNEYLKLRVLEGI